MSEPAKLTVGRKKKTNTCEIKKRLKFSGKKVLNKNSPLIKLSAEHGENWLLLRKRCRVQKSSISTK